MVEGRRQILRHLGLAGAGVGAAAAGLSYGSERAASDNAPLRSFSDPSFIDPRFDSRSVSFENPTGARGAGGKKALGRKGAPEHMMKPGERIILADLKGPGTIRHFWITVSTLRIGVLKPEVTRALQLEVFYDGASEPSVSVPLLDFFGLPHGRQAEFYSSLMSANEGRGLNSYIPMPFAAAARVEFLNGASEPVDLYYQIDYTLEASLQQNTGYLHATFRRENPTTLRRDFVIAEGLHGPGRFLGCVVGIRPIEPVNDDFWYGEGEVKIYRDGDREFPTYCGTGTEDYIGSAWGLDRHYGPYSGAPLNVCRPATVAEHPPVQAFVGFYRWHVLDPIMFQSELRVTIQQIGYAEFYRGQDAQLAAYRKDHASACDSWVHSGTGEVAWRPPGDSLAMGCVERADDYCATAFVYCLEPQAVPRLKIAAAAKDIGRLPFERSRA
jgi:hypothetical protein